MIELKLILCKYILFTNLQKGNLKLFTLLWDRVNHKKKCKESKRKTTSIL